MPPELIHRPCSKIPKDTFKFNLADLRKPRPYSITLNLDAATVRAIRYMCRHLERGKQQKPKAMLELLAYALMINAHAGVSFGKVFRAGADQSRSAPATYRAPGNARELMLGDLTDYLRECVRTGVEPTLMPEFHDASNPVMAEACARLFDQGIKVPAAWMLRFVSRTVFRAMQKGERPCRKPGRGFRRGPRERRRSW